jgi:hypothetical protein
MKRLRPRNIQDKVFLSELLELYLQTLIDSPLEVRLRALAYDTRIPESVFHRLMNLHRNPEDAVNIDAADFHVLFMNIQFRFPTVKLWLDEAGAVFIEM